MKRDKTIINKSIRAALVLASTNVNLHISYKDPTSDSYMGLSQPRRAKSGAYIISIGIIAKRTFKALRMYLITYPYPPAHHLSIEAIFILIHWSPFVLPYLGSLAANMKVLPIRKLAPINA